MRDQPVQLQLLRACEQTNTSVRAPKSNGNTNTVHVFFFCNLVDAFLGEDRDVGLGLEPAEVGAHDALA